MNANPYAILVVDDNQAVRDLLADRLGGRNFHVLMAKNGHQALATLRQHTVHLVLLDIMMPGMDGYVVLENIQADRELRRIPVVVMSALHDMASVVKCVKLGAEDYLFKPFDSALFWARINASLEKKRLQDQERVHLEELAVLQQIDRELNATLDLKKVAQIILGWAIRQTEATTGFIGEPTGLKFEVWAKAGLTEKQTANISPSTLGLASPPTSNHLQSILLAPDDVLSPGSVHRVVIPIHREGQVHGFLSLDNDQPYIDRHLNFLSRLSSHAAIALNNAQLYASAQAANHAKSEFVAFVAHELKAPLGVLMVYAELMGASGSRDLLTKQDRYSGIMERTIKRMDMLVSELQDITRIESGKMQLNATAVSLDQAIREVLLLFERQFAENEQVVIVDLDPNLPPLWADQKRLVQIVTNLVSNAHKYTPKGGQVKISARRQEGDTGSFVEVAIQDNGIGIEKADQEKIFTQFFRAANEQVEVERGTGLGLNITKQIVELQGGQIWFESELGQGTTLYFTLPVKEILHRTQQAFNSPQPIDDVTLQAGAKQESPK